MKTDLMTIGNRLYEARKRLGMTQAQAAEAAGISDRTYADVERGTAKMRVDTLLAICSALRTSPDVLLLPDAGQEEPDASRILAMLEGCTPAERRTALRLVEVYLRSTGR